MSGTAVWVDARGQSPAVPEDHPTLVKAYLLGEGDGELIFGTLTQDRTRPVVFQTYQAACNFLATARAQGLITIGPLHLEDWYEV